MRAVIQRVSKANVTVEQERVGQIDQGVLVLLGVSRDDNQVDCEYLVDKISNLRVFEDKQGKMNLSLRDIDGEVLVVSQFTLYADCRRGRRPNFTQAAPPEQAKQLYERFVSLLAESVTVETGVFQAHMQISLTNDGPVTIMLES